MGLYVEVADKKAWARKQVCVETPKTVLKTDEYLPVAYLDNGAFLALAVAFNKKELERLKNGRPDAAWMLVAKEELRKLVPGGERLKEFK